MVVSWLIDWVQLNVTGLIRWLIDCLLAWLVLSIWWAMDWLVDWMACSLLFDRLIDWCVALAPVVTRASHVLSMPIFTVLDKFKVWLNSIRNKSSKQKVSIFDLHFFQFDFKYNHYNVSIFPIIKIFSKYSCIIGIEIPINSSRIGFFFDFFAIWPTLKVATYTRIRPALLDRLPDDNIRSRDPHTGLHNPVVTQLVIRRPDLHFLTHLSVRHLNRLRPAVAVLWRLLGLIRPVERVPKQAPLHCGLIHDHRVLLIIARVTGDGHDAICSRRHLVVPVIFQQQYFQYSYPIFIFSSSIIHITRKVLEILVLVINAQYHFRHSY